MSSTLQSPDIGALIVRTGFGVYDSINIITSLKE